MREIRATRVRKSKKAQIIRQEKEYRYKKERNSNNVNLGFYAKTHSDKECRQTFSVSRGKVEYWRKKMSNENDNFHPLPHGGALYKESSFKFSPQRQLEYELELFQILREDPQLTLQEMKFKLYEKDFDVNLVFISRTLQKWRWSKRLADPKQIEKYSFSNIMKYIEYCTDIMTRPPEDFKRIKFLDESSFDPRKLHRQRYWGPMNNHTPTTTPNQIQAKSLTVTMLTSIDPDQHPLYVVSREESNNQFDFANFLIEALNDGYLRRYDIIILDNAKIHKGEDIWDGLKTLVEDFDLQIWYLPTYSPELNPNELVFAKVKSWIYNYRQSDADLLTDIIYAFSLVSSSDMVHYYQHCINYFANHSFYLPP